MHSEILPIFYTDILQKSTKIAVIRGQSSVTWDLWKTPPFEVCAYLPNLWSISEGRLYLPWLEAHIEHLQAKGRSCGIGYHGNHGALNKISPSEKGFVDVNYWFQLVPEVGIEPTRTQGPLDFESSASTSFTTPAIFSIGSAANTGMSPATAELTCFLGLDKRLLY